MLKMLIKCVMFIGLSLPIIHATCCHKTDVRFRVANMHKDCVDFDKANNDYIKPGFGTQNGPLALMAVADHMTNRRCKISVCGDGQKPYGYYCGRGSCNIFGCNCDGACIGGDAVENFRSRHGDEITGVRKANVIEEYIQK